MAPGEGASSGIHPATSASTLAVAVRERDSVRGRSRCADLSGESEAGLCTRLLGAMAGMRAKDGDDAPPPSLEAPGDSAAERGLSAGVRSTPSLPEVSATRREASETGTRRPASAGNASSLPGAASASGAIRATSTFTPWAPASSVGRAKDDPRNSAREMPPRGPSSLSSCGRGTVQALSD